jgi:hypothetical protein
MAAAASHRVTRPMSRHSAWTGAGVLAVLVLALLCVGGYVFHWRWSGLSSSVTLWDWLSVLALPVAVATAPLLLRHRRRLRRAHRVTMIAVLSGFAALVLAGYLVPLGWTGFRGNTLWDWLHLLLLPLAIPTILLPAALAITSRELME